MTINKIFWQKYKFFLTALFCSLFFFVTSFFTLSDYGVSWDEALHFRRGQAYIYYFLTGKLNYNNLPNPNTQGTWGDPQKNSSPRRSFYQNDVHNGEYLLKQDSGHPPINDELSALSNYIFFQKLGILDDINAHHLFNILAASLLVFVVVIFAVETLGIFSGLISFLVISTYPLFWAESHFNVKDPPEAAFFAMTIWTFYKSLNKGSIPWLLASILFFSLGLGTKFNILFIPFILLPYIFIRFRNNIQKPGKILRSIPRKYLVVLFLSPIIIMTIFFITWPYLWQNPINNFLNIIGYYKDIGTGFKYQQENFFFLGFNTFPIRWILFTTPPLALVLFVIGIISVIKRKSQKQNKVGILWLLWFIIPLVRVTMPGATIYGGIRQILEFLPALALLSGLGAWQIIQWCKTKRMIFIVQITIILLFIWPIIMLIKFHPYENTYFNFLIGGLQGAQKNNFPSWGNTFGSAYLDGAKWINKNAEKNAKLTLIQGTRANLPDLWLRKDIDFQNNNFSGFKRRGEYLMELIFNDTGKDFYYVWDYVNTFLDPVYELKIDNVAILKIWKNDLEHTKKDFKLEEIDFVGNIKAYKEKNNLTIDLDEMVYITAIELKFQKIKNCNMQSDGFVETSLDGHDWIKEHDPISLSQNKKEKNVKDGILNYFIAGKKAKEVKIFFYNQNFCGLNNQEIKIKILEGKNY